MLRTRLLVLIALAFTSASASDAAAILFGTGNASMNENVLFGHSTCGGCVDGPAVTVVGHGQNTNILVDFTDFNSPLVNLLVSGANTVTYDSAGQAGFSQLRITTPGYYITGVMFQLTALSTSTDGTVGFTAHSNIGDVASTSFALLHQGGGTNQYNITTSGGALITGLDISSSVLLHDISQVSISLTPVPEPATFGLMGAALAGIALWRRRRA